MLPFKEINDLTPKKGTIVDLGCGEGTIAQFLAHQKRRIVIGVDLNKKRLQKSHHQNLSFEHKNIKTYNLKNVDCVILSDVLHHMSFNDQDQVLINIAKGLKKEGVLLIKEIDTSEFIRSRLSRIWDFVFYPKERIYFNNAQTLLEKIEKLGFSVNIMRPTRFFPGSTTLFVCKKQ